jgi:hypothetical protein
MLQAKEYILFVERIKETLTSLNDGDMDPEAIVNNIWEEFLTLEKTSTETQNTIRNEIYNCVLLVQNTAIGNSLSDVRNISEKITVLISNPFLSLMYGVQVDFLKNLLVMYESKSDTSSLWDLFSQVEKAVDTENAKNIDVEMELVTRKALDCIRNNPGSDLQELGEELDRLTLILNDPDSSWR